MIYGIEAADDPAIVPPIPPGNPARFIAAGNVGQSSPLIATTENDDASFWVDRSAAAALVAPNAILQAIAYSPSLDRWVAGGYDNSSFGDPRVIYSDDGGNTWTAATPDPLTDFMIFGLCWTGSAFIAVGQDSTVTDPRIMTSADGINWTSRTSDPATGCVWHGVHGISGLAVVVGGVDEFGSPDKLASSSNDGASWTARTPPSSPSFLESVVLISAGTHVCAGFDSVGAHQMGTSANGTSWSNQNGVSDHQYYGIAHNGSLYVAVGFDYSTNLEARIATSSNATAWTNRTPDPTTAVGGINLLSVASGVGGGFVAIGRDNNLFNTPYIMYSADGQTWAARTCDPASGCMLQGVAGRA